MTEIGGAVSCVACGRPKAPRGRSVAPAMAGSLCDDGCIGYRQDPKPGDLWPGEYRPECSACGGGFPFHTVTACKGVWRYPDDSKEEE